MSESATVSFLRALGGDRVARPPIWFPPAAEAEPLDALLAPGFVAERTLEPVRVLGVDAAGLYTSAAVVLHLAGIAVEQMPGRGPVVDAPVRRASEVLGLRPLEQDALEPIRQAASRATAALDGVPLVGIAPAPFTLASLLVEGAASHEHLRARTLMYADPHAWAGLLNWCADVTGAFLRAQVEAGAAAVQLADPAVGALSRREYLKRVVPHTQRALSHLRGAVVPVIHSGTGAGEFLDLMAAAGAAVVGVDRRIPLDDAARRVDDSTILQGNLDPALLGASRATLRSHVADVLDRGLAARAHIVAFDGAVPAGTDPELLAWVVRAVHGDEPLD